jgi:hypothetical protein
MNINLGQANGVCLSKWQMWALKHLAGAEAHAEFGGLLCGLKPVPFTVASTLHRNELSFATGHTDKN